MAAACAARCSSAFAGAQLPAQPLRGAARPGPARAAGRVQCAAKDSAPNVAVVGVTGAVGQEFLKARRRARAPRCAMLVVVGWRRRMLRRRLVLPHPTCARARCVLRPAQAVAFDLDGVLLLSAPVSALARFRPQVMEQRNFPVGKVKLLASAKSAGKPQAFAGKQYTIEELTEDRHAPSPLSHAHLGPCLLLPPGASPERPLHCDDFADAASRTWTWRCSRPAGRSAKSLGPWRRPRAPLSWTTRPRSA